MRSFLPIGTWMSFLFISVSASAQWSTYCKPAFAKVDLDINNVRATIMGGGDLWWDLNNSNYEIPKGSDKHSISCGNIWMGAIDGNGQLHVAAGTYRQTGTDFWSGPLDTLGGNVIDSTCREFDRFWKLNRADVESFVMNRNDPNYIIPEAILSWPGNGNPSRGTSHILAPFTDVDGDLIYDPLKGDYPMFSFTGQNDCDHNLLGDQAIWWVFNDKGSYHSETGGAALGIEIQATAFAFRSSNDKLNDATFYRYKLFNRSTNTYSDTWFSNWWSAGIGDNYDDYVGCDVARGLAFQYNGDLADGNSNQTGAGTYGLNPPAIGMDYLGGPFANANDWVDNDRDLILDEANERIALSRMVAYDNNCCITDEPWGASQYYGYMKGYWKDNTHLHYGGNGYSGQYECDYMFPGDSDPYGWGTYGQILSPWDEATSGNTPSRRRQLNSVGPFTMEPGEVEVITVGIPWARDVNGDNLDAVDRLKEADDYIQTLFDNCFSVPCADEALPEITHVLRNELAYFTLLASGTSYSWDFGDGQHSTDKHPSHYYSTPGTYYVWANVTSACGTHSDVDTIIIRDQLATTGPAIWRIEGLGNGKQELEFSKETIDEILSSPEHRSLFPMYTPLHGPVKITYEDYYALESGDYRIAFDSTDDNAHWKMWKVGETDTVFSYSTIQSGNLQRITMWGLGVEIQQVNRIGSGYNVDRNGYLTSSIAFEREEKNWLTGIPDSDSDKAENWIRSGARLGTGVCVADFNDRMIGVTPIDRNEDFENMIGRTWGPYRLCAYAPSATQTTICYEAGPGWSPSPTSSTVANKLENLSNVDVVFTNDSTKWTRCVVVETGANTSLTENGTAAFRMRTGLSVNKRGLNINNGALSDVNNPEAADYIGASGMGWFPGYAINLETGERLNMAFGENSALSVDHGRDMLWNPTSTVATTYGVPIWGGMHYVYVFGHNGDAIFTSGALQGELQDVPMYDHGKMIHTVLASSLAQSEMRAVYSDAMWTNIPILQEGHDLLECDVTVKLRMQKPFAKYQTDSVPLNRNFPLYGFRIDKENLGVNLYPGTTMVYPNPFTDECVIQFSNVNNHKTRVELYDMQGKLVRTYEDFTGERLTISAAGLFSGVYLWQLQVEGQEAEVGKIILR